MALEKTQNDRKEPLYTQFFKLQFFEFRQHITNGKTKLLLKVIIFNEGKLASKSIQTCVYEM